MRLTRTRTAMLGLLLTIGCTKKSKLGETCADSASCDGELRCKDGQCHDEEADRQQALRQKAEREAQAAKLAEESRQEALRRKEAGVRIETESAISRIEF